MTTILLPVPNAPGPGAWVDCSSLGEFPEAQLDPAAVAADLVNLETAAFATAVLGKQIQQLSGGSPSATLLQQTAQGRQSIPLAYVRAVRVAGPTAGLNANISTSNLSTVGAPGPTGYPVQGSMLIVPGAAPWVFLQPGARGIASVTTAIVNGFRQVVVTFSSAFNSTNYSVNANWWDSTIAPTPLQPIAWNNAPAADGRTMTSVTFELWNALTGAPVDPSAGLQGGMMLTCG